MKGFWGIGLAGRTIRHTPNPPSPTNTIMSTWPKIQDFRWHALLNSEYDPKIIGGKQQQTGTTDAVTKCSQEFHHLMASVSLLTPNVFLHQAPSGCGFIVFSKSVFGSGYRAPQVSILNLRKSRFTLLVACISAVLPRWG